MLPDEQEKGHKVTPLTEEKKQQGGIFRKGTIDHKPGQGGQGGQGGGKQGGGGSKKDK
jgi:hypothetical protein